MVNAGPNELLQPTAGRGAFWWTAGARLTRRG
jgi:hypothetical protein